MIDVAQPLQVSKNVKNATLHRIPNASHDLHQRYAAIFKKLTEKHILSHVCAKEPIPNDQESVNEQELEPAKMEEVFLLNLLSD